VIEIETDTGAPRRVARISCGRRGWSFTAAAAVLGGLFTVGASAPATAQEPTSAVQAATEGAGNPCMQCHTDIAGQSGTWNGRRFTHTPHVRRANLDCTFCHTPIENHGGMKLTSVAQCNDCHHNRTSGASCSRCHKGGAGAPKGILALEAGDFDHTRHTAAGLPCTSCHAGATMSAVKVQCTSCHVAHHRPEADCLACHRPGTTPEHPKQIHLEGCAGCHGENGAWIDKWTRQTCTVCHTDRTDHYPERSCAVCHLVPDPPAADG